MSRLVEVPYFAIYINGVEIDNYRMTMLESIDYEDNASGSDLLTLTFYDPDLKILSDNIFVEECSVYFVGGWLWGDVVTFNGYISLIDIDFPEQGTPKITIHCMDSTYLMNRDKKKRTWENAKVSDIARQIFTEYGLSAVVDDTGTVEENVSQSETDIKFLTQLADDQYETYLVYVEGTTGYFVKKPNLVSPQAQLDYRSGNGNLLSFSPRINKQSKRVKTESSEVNTKDNKVDKAETNDSLARPTSGETVKASNHQQNSGVTWRYENGTWVKK